MSTCHVLFRSTRIIIIIINNNNNNNIIMNLAGWRERELSRECPLFQPPHRTPHTAHPTAYSSCVPHVPVTSMTMVGVSKEMSWMDR